MNNERNARHEKNIAEIKQFLSDLNRFKDSIDRLEWYTNAYNQDIYDKLESLTSLLEKKFLPQESNLFSIATLNNLIDKAHRALSESQSEEDKKHISGLLEGLIKLKEYNHG